MKDERTLSQLAQEALNVQDASNLSGVVLGWGRSISRLRELIPTAGTDAINRHPINKLWADKVAHLTNMQYSPLAVLAAAFDAVTEIAATTPRPEKPDVTRA